MNERRNVPEIVIGTCELLRRTQTRIKLLFTMSEITHAHPAKDATCEVMFRGRYLNGKLCLEDNSSIFNSIWWSQTGSNRRPHACKARALPAELWPRTRRRNASRRSGNSKLKEKTHSIKWWAWEDLNFRPHAYQARALTN